MNRGDKEEGWIWIERVISRFPVPYFVVTYFLFFFLLYIFYFLSTKTSWLDLSDPDVLIVVLITCFVIPFELVGIKLQLDGSKEIFRYLDDLFKNSQSRFYPLLKDGIFRSRENYLLLLLSIGFPLVFLSWSGLAFYNAEKDNPFNLSLDIYNNLVLLLTIYLLCLIIWIQVNAYRAFHIASRDLKGNLLSYNIYILRRNLNSVRGYFIKFLFYFIICISLINISFFGMALEITINAAFLILLFFFGVALAIGGLVDSQRIIDEAVRQNLYNVNDKLEESSNKLISMLLTDSKEQKEEIERLQMIIGIYQQDWEKIAQQKSGLDLKDSFKEFGAIIITIIIPIISFMISLKQKV